VLTADCRPTAGLNFACFLSSPCGSAAGFTTSASGEPHARTHVILLVDDLHVRVVNATTRELIRELIIDPTRDYQPQYTKKPPNP